MAKEIYQVDVIKVIDGDTFKGIVNLGFGISVGVNFRVLGLNSPELHKGTQMEKAEGIRAKLKANSLLQGKSVRVSAEGTDKYGRTLADVTLPDGSDFAKTMIQNGFGKAMPVSITS